VEVVSPNDLAVQVHNKVREYLDAGVAAVWVVYLETRDGEVWNRGRTAMTGVEPSRPIACPDLRCNSSLSSPNSK